MSTRQITAIRDLFAAEHGMDLYQRAMKGGLRDCPVRSLVWRYFLGAFQGPCSGWAEQMKAQQAEYDALCGMHAVDPSAAAAASDLDVSVVNPLSTDERSPWNDSGTRSLRHEIEQDLVRLYPGESFFARADVQAVMQRLLLVWALANPDVSYRQGMHELCALLVQVAWHDADEAAAANPATNVVAPGDEVAASAARALLAGCSLEVGAWSLFSRVMLAAREYFAPGAGGGGAGSRASATTPLLSKCAHLQGVRLKACDPTLHTRLVALGIEPQLYLLRWLRLLFGREFHLEDVKVIWDAMFAFGLEAKPFSAAAAAGAATAAGADGVAGRALTLVDDFALAMLMYVREDVMRQDFTTAMKRLLKFPPVEDVQFLVQRALQLRRAHQQQSRMTSSSATTPAVQAAAPVPPAAAPPLSETAPRATPAESIPATTNCLVGVRDTEQRTAMASAAASALVSTTAAEEPWRGEYSHLRQPPDW